MLEFDRHVLETLREPLEAGAITISRAAWQTDFPTACQLVAATLPGVAAARPKVRRVIGANCPGRCSTGSIQIELPALPPAEMASRAVTPGEPSGVIARRGAAARERQRARQGKTNRELSGRETDEVCRPDAAGAALLREAGERFGWSARAYYRALKIGRTIADLAGAAMPEAAHVAEAVQYRRALTDQ